MQELVTEEEIIEFLQQKWHRENSKLYPVLFHGTDIDLINKQKAEFEHIKDVCGEVSHRLFQLFKENGFDVNSYDKRFEGHKDSYGDTNTAIRYYSSNQRGNSKYQYGNLYITNGVDRAIGYSEMAWILGEWGWIAYRLYDSAKRLNMDLPTDEEFAKNLAVFEERMNQIKQPVVLLFTDISTDVLIYEIGFKIRKEEEKIAELKKGYSISSYKFINNDCTLSSANCFIRKENYGNLRKACEQLGLNGLLEPF